MPEKDPKQGEERPAKKADVVTNEDRKRGDTGYPPTKDVERGSDGVWRVKQ